MALEPDAMIDGFQDWTVVKNSPKGNQPMSRFS